MFRVLLADFALVAVSHAQPCPLAYDYSTSNGLAPALPITISASSSFNDSLSLNFQEITLSTPVNATGIAIYPRVLSSNTAGPYNITGAIYVNVSGIMQALATTDFVIGSNWGQYPQTTELKPLVLPFKQPIALNATSYFAAFWAMNQTVNSNTNTLQYATAVNTAFTYTLPVSGSFGRVPMSIDSRTNRSITDTGYLTSIISQPITCFVSSSSSTGGNGVAESHFSRSWLMGVILVVVSVLYV